jgi:hypothetical protein
VDKSTLSPTMAAEFRVWEKTYDDRINKSWEITEALIEQLKKDTSSLHMKLIIFYVPDRAEVYLEEWEDTLKKFGLQAEDWDIQKPARKLGEICKALNIDYINATDEFRKEAMRLNGQQLYWRYDRHWNDKGHQLAANILCNYIYKHCLY